MVHRLWERAYNWGYWHVGYYVDVAYARMYYGYWHVRYYVDLAYARIYWAYWGWQMRRAVRHGMIYPHIDD
jgi:hypothetical protein